MKNNLIECMAIASYLEAAEKIAEELEVRGFTTDRPDNGDDLICKMAEIIQKTVQGNTNYAVGTPAPFECGCRHLPPSPVPNLPVMGCDGWEGDLQNQGPPDSEDYPPWHPLEN